MNRKVHKQIKLSPGAARDAVATIEILGIQREEIQRVQNYQDM